MLKIRRKEDRFCNVTIRLPERVLKLLDRMAAEANCSRNELVNRLLEWTIENAEIE